MADSLLAPADRDSTFNNPTLNKGVTLTEEEVVSAMQELNNMSFTSKFPRVDKFYADPALSNQVYCLHSFVPAKGATPDKDGIYGMIKCRGTFQTEREANDRSEYIIRNVDSMHSIFHSYVGRPFPLSFRKDYISETKEIDIKKKVVESVSEDIKQKQEEERKTIEDMKEREKKLLQETSGDYVENPLDKYTTLQVKRAQLIWTYVESMKKIEHMREIITKTRKEIQDMDNESDSYKKEYYEKYMVARKESGLPDNVDSFIKYMGEDIELDF
jgi:hypothetical protein